VDHPFATVSPEFVEEVEDLLGGRIFPMHYILPFDPFPFVVLAVERERPDAYN
jgi:hypothetical protein